MSALKRISDLKPEAKSPVQLLAFLVHVCMLNRGAKLIGVTDDAKEEKVEDCPAGWNAGQIYTFKYKDTVADSIVLVKCLPMGPMLVVSAAVEGKDVIHTLDLRVADHIDTKGKFDSKELNYKELFLKLEVSDAVVSEKISKIVLPKSVNEKAKEEKEKQDAAREKARRQERQNILPSPVNPFAMPRQGRNRGNIFDGDRNPFGPGGGNLLGPRGIGQPAGPRYDPVNPFAIPNDPNPDGIAPPGMRGIPGFNRPGRRRGGGNPFGGGGGNPFGGGGGFGFGGGGFM